MARERSLTDGQILNALIEGRKKYADLVKQVETISVNESECIPAGIFYYIDKSNEEEKGKKVITRLFLLSETREDGKTNIIYDETGRVVAWQVQAEGMKLHVAGDISLDDSMLKRQLAQAHEKARKSEDDTKKAGEGRDLADKEHEEKPEEEKTEQEEKSDEEQTEEEKEQEQEGTENKTLKNLRDDININNKPKIELNQIINGYYLWEILQLDDKLKGRLPEGLDPSSFRSGYLTFIDSHDLEAKDGKHRKGEETFVLETLSGDIIELDEKVLKPKDLGTKEERKKTEQSRIHYENGKEAEKPDINSETTLISSFEIPNVKQRLNVAESWRLEVVWNRDYLLKNKAAMSGNKKGISFVQVPENESVFDREMGRNGVSYKLMPINERPLPEKAKGQKIQDEHLRRKDPDEALHIRKAHVKRLVKRCFAENKGADEVLSTSDVTRIVESEHRKGASDEEIIKIVGTRTAEAARKEHDFPGLRRRH